LIGLIIHHSSSIHAVYGGIDHEKVQSVTENKTILVDKGLY
jgi:hypothetical protein